MTVLLVIPFLGLLIPSHAAAFSFGSLQALFGRDAEALTYSAKNSPSVQAMAILEASASPTPAKGGGDITIVSGSAVLAEEGPSGTIADIQKPKNATISVYVVREGDTLSQIADMFEVTVNTIRWANNLTGPIRPGQTLVILPVTGIKYTVKKGDTLASIAKQYHGDADEIAQFNGISEGGLAVGAEIIVPNGEVSAPAAPARKASTAIASGGSSSSYAGYYMRPIAGGVRTQGVHGYNAVDLAAPIGTPIMAAASGEVIIARQGGWNGGYGSYVVIRHANGTQTLYAHASSVIVGVGQYVVQGQVIGYVGSTGKSTGAHVHFEIRNGPRNPF